MSIGKIVLDNPRAVKVVLALYSVYGFARAIIIIPYFRKYFKSVVFIFLREA